MNEYFKILLLVVLFASEFVFGGVCGALYMYLRWIHFHPEDK